jgi:WD40 repeat protein
LSADREPRQDPASDAESASPVAEVFQVDASGAQGVLVGGLGTQINYFYQGTWSDGVAPVPLVTTSGAIDSPYRGLQSFGEADAAFFFGRETAVSDVLDRLAGCLPVSGLLVVSGVSGAGKTSLVRAGVLPRLRGTGLPGVPEAAAWPCVILVPGGRPLDELAVRIASAAGTDAASVRRSLESDPADFALIARQAAFSGGARGARRDNGQQRVLIVCDQFETVFTECEREEERAAFIAALRATADSGSAAVVLVIRADLEARLADYPALVGAAQERYLLTAMTERQLRLAIVRPAVSAGASVDDELVEELLREVRPRLGEAVTGGAQPGGAHVGERTADSGRMIGAGVLPLLSHALDQAWRSRSALAITLADYERTGGIEGAVAVSAQRAFDGLTPAQQAAARQVFTRLTATTPEGIDMAVRVPRAELLAPRPQSRAQPDDGGGQAEGRQALTGKIPVAARVGRLCRRLLGRHAVLPGDPAGDGGAAAGGQRPVFSPSKAGHAQVTAGDIVTVLETFVGERLVTLAAGTVEISHEVLLSAWPLLRDDWLAGTRADRAERTRLQATVAEWIKSEHDRAYLYSGSRLDSAARAAHRISADGRHAVLSQGEADFLLASRKSAARRSRIRRGVIAVGAALSLGLAVALVIAVAANSTARTELRDETSGALASESPLLDSSDPVRAAQDSVQAWSLEQTPQSQYALLTAAANPLVAVDPGTTEALSGAFSPDGTTMAVGYGSLGGSSWVQLLDPYTDAKIGGQLAVLRPSAPGSPAMAHGPSAEFGMTDINNLLLPVAFSPDGKTLAVGQGSRLSLWNTASGKRISTMPAFLTGAADSLAFSPDGKTLLVSGLLCGGDSGCAELWNVATGKEIGTPFGAAGLPGVLAAFSPNGDMVATTGPGSTVRLWSTATSQQVGGSFSVPDGVESLTFSPDGAMLATGGGDGTVRLWNVATGRQSGTALAPAGAQAVDAVTFSPDGSFIAGGESDGTVQVWNVATRLEVGGGLTGGSEPVTSVSFSPGGTTLASTNEDGATRLWNLAAIEGRPAGPPVSVVPDVAGDGMGGLALGPHDTLVSSDYDNNVTVWNAASGARETSAEVPDPAGPEALSLGTVPPPRIAVSPDGKTLISGADDSSIRIWRLPGGLEAGRPTVTIPLPKSVGGGKESAAAGVGLLAFSPDGREFAAVYGNGSIQVFDTATGRPVGHVVSVGEAGVPLLAVAFVPGTPGYGDLITINSSGSVTILDPDAKSPAQLAATTVAVGTDPTAAAFGPITMSGPVTSTSVINATVAVGGADGTVRLLDTATNEQIGSAIAAGGSPVHDLAFSPGDAALATGGENGTAQLWNVSYLTPAAALAQECAAIRPTISPVGWAAAADLAGMSYEQGCTAGSAR